VGHAGWLKAAIDFIKGAFADVVILNEMGIGMARTDQQHTTKLMAQMLNMNYAWGLEFVELTDGDKEEQGMFGGLPNFHGLHVTRSSPAVKYRILSSFVMQLESTFWTAR
jgi:hypothetical protein